MKLLTKKQRAKLIENGLLQDAVRGTENEIDFRPVLKLFTPDRNWTWLLTELDPDNPHIAFGLCDLGMGCPELGYVSLKELNIVRSCSGFSVEQDCGFEAKYFLSEYARIARKWGCIQD